MHCAVYHEGKEMKREASEKSGAIPFYIFRYAFHASTDFFSCYNAGVFSCIVLHLESLDVHSIQALYFFQLL